MYPIAHWLKRFVQYPRREDLKYRGRGRQFASAGRAYKSSPIGTSVGPWLFFATVVGSDWKFWGASRVINFAIARPATVSESKMARK